MIYRSRESDEDGPQFVLNRQSPAAKADLIVIDECSMVDEELGRDLLSFGQPVLVLGDPAQLPPVKGGGFFTEARARRDAHGGAPAGQGQSDHAYVDEGARGRAARARHLWREPRHPPPRDRRRAGHGGRPGARRPQQDAAPLQHAPARAQRLPRPDAGGRREARLPAQRQDQGPAQRRHLDHPGPARHPQRLRPHGCAARRRGPPPIRGGLRAQGFLRGHGGGAAASCCAASRTSSPTAMR